MSQIGVVVVDDSARMRKAIVEALRSVRGCNILGEGGNGLEALELARALRPNLVVMDIHMPFMDGLEAMRLLKSELPCTQVVLVSTMLEPEVRAEAMKSGAVACLTKGEELWGGLLEVVSHLSQASPANTS